MYSVWPGLTADQARGVYDVHNRLGGTFSPFSTLDALTSRSLRIQHIASLLIWTSFRKWSAPGPVYSVNDNLRRSGVYADVAINIAPTMDKVTQRSEPCGVVEYVVVTACQSTVINRHSYTTHSRLSRISILQRSSRYFMRCNVGDASRRRRTYIYRWIYATLLSFIIQSFSVVPKRYGNELLQWQPIRFPLRFALGLIVGLSAQINSDDIA